MKPNALHLYLRSRKQPTFLNVVRLNVALRTAVLFAFMVTAVVSSLLANNPASAAINHGDQFVVICTSDGFAKVEVDGQTTHSKGTHCSCILGCVSSCCAGRLAVVSDDNVLFPLVPTDSLAAALQAGFGTHKQPPGGSLIIRGPPTI